jgi:hypothetical protein
MWTEQVEDTDTVDADDNKGACGDTSLWDITVIGAVSHQGQFVEGATVELEDRGYNTGQILGSGVTDSDGVFELDAFDVVSVEDCWGTLLNYYIVAEFEDIAGEKKANTYLHTAIYDESLEADMRGFPVELE